MRVKTPSQRDALRRDVAWMQNRAMNDDLLVSWKDIAAYLKCSVRKAQRLEQRALPVNRIPGTKSVWASRAEIDRWLDSQAARAKSIPDLLMATAADYPGNQSAIPANSVTEKV